MDIFIPLPPPARPSSPRTLKTNPPPYRVQYFQAPFFFGRAQVCTIEKREENASALGGGNDLQGSHSCASIQRGASTLCVSVRVCVTHTTLFFFSPAWKGVNAVGGGTKVGIFFFWQNEVCVCVRIKSLLCSSSDRSYGNLLSFRSVMSAHSFALGMQRIITETCHTRNYGGGRT